MYDLICKCKNGMRIRILKRDLFAMFLFCLETIYDASKLVSYWLLPFTLVLGKKADTFFDLDIFLKYCGGKVVFNGHIDKGKN